MTGPPPGPPKGKIASWGPGLVLLVSSSLLILAPLAYGAVHPWAYFGLGAAVSVLGLALLIFGIYRIWAKPQEKWLLPYPPIWWLGVGLGLVPLLQIVSFPQGILRALSPAAWEIRALGDGFGLAAYLPLSLNPYATVLEFLKLSPAVLLFFILILVINSRRQIRLLVGIILAVAVFEVFYGLANLHDNLIWGWPNPYADHRLCGTFIDSNHLAIYLSMAILLGFGLFLEEGGKAGALSPSHPGSAASSRLRGLSRAEHSEPRFRQLLILFLLLLITAGLIFTGSRGGMASLIFGFLLMIGLVWGRRRKRGQMILFGVFLGIALLFSLLLGGAPQLGRFENLHDLERAAAWKGAVHIFREFPWTGSGIGTFGELFYRYEPAAMAGKYCMYTHNDWLQALCETGIGGLILMVAAYVALGGVLVRQWRQRSSPFPRGLGLGGIAALGAGGFHALTEFPFHIPALSLTYGAIAALTYLAVFSQSQDGADFFSYPAIRVPGPGKRAICIMSCLLLGQLVFLGQIWKYYSAEYHAPMETNSTRPQPDLRVADFRMALTLNPLNSKYYFGLAESLEKQGPQSRQNLEEAEKSLQAAILRAPGWWGYHYELAEFCLRRQIQEPGRYLPMGMKELAAAVRLFPESAALHLRLATLISWAEIYYPGLVPKELQGQSGRHFRMAAKIDPNLSKYWANALN